MRTGKRNRSQVPDVQHPYLASKSKGNIEKPAGPKLFLENVASSRTIKEKSQIGLFFQIIKDMGCGA